VKPSQKLSLLLEPLYRKLRDVEVTALKRHMPSGVTLGDIRMLRAVDRVGVSGVSAVASYLEVSQPAVTVAVCRLEDRKLVVRTQTKDDGRKRALAPTSKGREIITAYRLAEDEMAALILGPIAESEKAKFVSALDKLVKSSGLT
jgi:DNA-binding MarR family transcriptional regulator